MILLKDKMELYQLKQKQSLPLDIKINLTKKRIMQFYKLNQGKVYISYSGGKDSEVMLHIIKEIYPEIIVVFVDTGTEIDTRKHAMKKADVILRPKKTMLEIWNKYGLPFPSKQQADFIYKVKHTKSDYLRSRLMTGIMKDGRKTMFKISEKWKPLIESDIEVSDRCCYYLKKEPFFRYNKETGNNPFIGTMADDGLSRKKEYLQNSCINIKRNKCTPLGFWTEQDVLRYIRENKLDYCDAYGDIIEKEGKFQTTKAKRTGCCGCLFGIHLETEPNRLQRMYKDNPRLHNIVLRKWCGGKIKRLLDMFNIKYK